jgi:hypothetical protein
MQALVGRATPVSMFQVVVALVEFSKTFDTIIVESALMKEDAED